MGGVRRDRERNASLRRVGLTWDVLVRWDRGGWRPFVGTGVTMQLFRPKVRGQAVDDDALNFGATLGGGFEVVLSRHTAITAEATYFMVERGRLVHAPPALAVRGGLKQSF